MKWVVVALFLLCVAYVHQRGRVRHSFFGQLFDHSGFLAPINVFMYAFSRVPSKPYLDSGDFPELAVLDQHWQTIRDEGERLMEASRIKAPDQHNDAGFNSFAKVGWKRFYLKWYEDAHPSARTLCPQTTEILSRLPTVKAAMFAELPDGAKLNAHRDPYAGSLRYHLGLATPNDDRCNITVDGEVYSWRDGQSVVFDETFIHEAENRSGRNRLILFCDVARPMKYRWAQAVNDWIGAHIVTAAASPNEAGDKTGLINRLFVISHVAGQQRRRLKRWNKTVYNLTKIALIAAVVAAFVFLI
ncbi:lipid A hydroxylase LpxO [soil metagenome]